MRFRRRLPILVAVGVIAAAIAFVVLLRRHAPPEAARLLPGADGFFYVDLKWIRTFSAASEASAGVARSEYQKFVDETGFEFEHDLDEAAFAVHYPQSWGGGPPNLPEVQFSEVFVGKFDSSRLIPYLKKISSSVKNYRSFDIYNSPLEGRTVRSPCSRMRKLRYRITLNPEVIRGIVDRSRKSAWPFAGPSL